MVSYFSKHPRVFFFVTVIIYYLIGLLYVNLYMRGHSEAMINSPGIVSLSGNFPVMLVELLRVYVLLPFLWPIDIVGNILF